MLTPAIPATAHQRHGAPLQNIRGSARTPALPPTTPAERRVDQRIH
uniref:Uncharacterized protein n=1 Tax=Rhodocyclus tenuis TaxID=1066 RepID=A0A840G6M6_RHOTE|nr:hypothetical protein [Rhodocyclus tenuis]